MAITQLDRFENGLANAEKFLNVTGIVPLVTGVVRGVIGEIQVISGVVAGCFFALAEAFSSSSQDRSHFRELAKRSFEHVFHGIGNIVRGVIEEIGLGVLLYVIYDHTLESRMKYMGEQKMQGVTKPCPYIV